MDVYPPTKVSYQDNGLTSLLLTAVSWVTFSLTLCLFALAQEIGPVIWALWSSALLLAVFVVSMAWARRMPAQMLLGYFLLAALLLAVPFGESVAQSFTDEFFRIRGGATYRIGASMPGASVLDATVLHFDKDDFINVSKSVGFQKAGHLHCVAPILSRKDQRAVSFWVVGMDCCEGRGNFHCFTAQDITIRAGVVMNDRGGSFTKAARMAQSVYDLEILTKNEIRLLAWMKDPEMYLQHLCASAITWAAISSAGWLLLSCCVAPCIVHSSYRR
eukprot:symbB.v1.2.011491.t1/scaffold768.1/size164025/4